MRISKLEPRTQPIYKISLTLEELQKLWHILNCSAASALMNYRESTGNTVQFNNIENVVEFKSYLWSAINLQVS